MKTLFKKILILALMFGTLTSYANLRINEAKFYPKKLHFDDVKKGHHFSVKNNSGKIIYTEIVNKTGAYTTDYDLANLKDGLYTVELNKDFEINIKTFAVTSGTVTFIGNTDHTVYKPSFRSENNKLFISKLNLNEKGPFSIKVYFYNDLIHSESADNALILSRIYVLDDYASGNYEIVLKTTTGRTYKKSFKL
jgi:hypothetical protein